MTAVDAAAVERAEQRFIAAVRDLQRIAFLAADPDEDVSVPDLLEWVLADFTAALDELQVGLGRPYVWLLSRSA